MKLSRMLVAAGAATGVGLAMIAGPAQATSPGRNGLIAFVNMEQVITGKALSSGNYQFRALTVSGDNRGPRWSPDGTRIAYYTRQGAVRTVNADGTATTTLVAAGGFQPAWDGNSTIAFVKNTNNKGDIYTISTAGGQVRRLTTDGAAGCGDQRPGFSADGRYFAYEQRVKSGSTCSGEVLLKVIDRTTQTTKVYKQPGDVCWSWGGGLPDGGRLDFTADSRHILYGTCAKGSGVFIVLDLTSGQFSSIDAPDDPWNGYQGPAPAPMPSGGTTFDAPFYAVDNVIQFDDADVQPLPR